MARYKAFNLTIPQITLLAGLKMSMLGIIFFGLTDYITALFPVLFGVVLVASANLSIKKPEKNALAMHIAVLTSVLCLILGISSALFGTWTTVTSLIEQLMMSGIALVHLTLCVDSFYYGRSQSPGDPQVCGVNTELVDDNVNSPLPASVVALTFDQ